MKFNRLDCALIGFVATVAASQFLRSTRDFSRILCESPPRVRPIVTASWLLGPVREPTGLSAQLPFGGFGSVLGVSGIIFAALVSRQIPFGLGGFNYLFGLLLAIACTGVLGHLGLRTADLAVAPRNPALASPVRHSLPTRDPLCLGAFTKVHASFSFVRSNRT